MPSVCNTKTGSMEKLPQQHGENETPIEKMLSLLDKKIRNLEKRKGKLDGYQQKLDQGVELIKDQKDALSKFETVKDNLEFARDLQKSFKEVLADNEKQQRRLNKRLLMEKQLQEQLRVQDLLRVQVVLGNMSHERAKSDFLAGKHGALVLSEESIKQLSEFQQLITPFDLTNERFSEKLSESSEALAKYLDGKDAEVAGTTYSDLKQLTQKIENCGYFQNFVPDEEETEEVVVEEVSPSLETPAVESVAVPADSSENTLPETMPATDDTLLTEPVKPDSCSHDDASVVISSSQITHVTTDLSSNPPDHTNYQTPDEFNNGVYYPATNQPRQKPLHEIVSAMQCDFNFLQESEIGEMQTLENSVPQPVYSYVSQSYAPMHGVYTSSHMGHQMDSQTMMMQPYPAQMITLPYGQHMVSGEGIYVPHALPVSYGQHMAITTGYNMVETYAQPHDSMSHHHTYYDPNLPVVETQPIEEVVASVDDHQAPPVVAEVQPAADLASEAIPHDGDNGQDPKRDLNPNANVFKSKFSNDGSEDGNHENTSDPQDPIANETDADFNGGSRGSGRGGRGRGVRGGNGYFRGNRGYNNGPGYNGRGSGNGYQRYPRNDYRQDGYNNRQDGYNNRQDGYNNRQDGYNNGHSEYNSWRGQRRESGGGRGGRGYARGNNGFNQEHQHGKDLAA